MSALSMLKNVRKNIIYNSAVASNRIRPFSEEVDNNLRNIIYSVMPAIIYIKYERPTRPPGNCRERAYLLSTAIENSVVVFGNQDDIGEHFWVETQDICYDPTSLLEYEKDVYYSLHGIKKTTVISQDELASLGFIQYCHRRKIEDFDTDPTYFRDLDFLLSYIQGGLKYRALKEYKEEVDLYLERLGYYRKKTEVLKQNIFKSGQFML